MDDTISRQAAIDAVYKCPDVFAGDMPVMVVKADAYEALAQLPSAQPQMCDDAISREDAKWVVFCNRDHVEDQANAIDSLPCVQPSAQPEQRWIPFAEHRPWEGQQILVCSEDGVMWITVFRSLIGFSGAWLPLPEPYKGEP